jgi:diacylglycerol diphosphate phosphatase/phosphatidate phosphatase
MKRSRSLFQRFPKNKWWSWWYLLDWVISIFFFVLVIVLFELHLVPPFERFKVWTVDGARGEEFMYPVKPSIIPTWLLIILCLLPFPVYAIFQIWQKSLHDWHHATLSQLAGITITLLITDVLKFLGGRYRPSYLARCNPNPVSGVCQNSGKEVIDGQLSFPSGHSSTIFVSWTFLCIYLSAKLGVFSSKGGQLWKFILAWSPMAVAFFVAISRTMDYHHHFSDILAGAIIGFVCAWISYYLNYPPITDENCKFPKKQVS